MTEELVDLAATLEKQRKHVLHSLNGLTDDQVTTPTDVSAMPLLGIVQHLGYVERRWLHMGGAGRAYGGYFPPDPTKEFSVSGQSTAQVVAAYLAITEESDELIATFADGDAPCRTKQLQDLLVNMGGRGVIREVLLHLIEETARHAGQADIIRESIDGTVGI